MEPPTCRRRFTQPPTTSRRAQRPSTAGPAARRPATTTRSGLSTRTRRARALSRAATTSRCLSLRSTSSAKRSARSRLSAWAAASTTSRPLWSTRGCRGWTPAPPVSTKKKSARLTLLLSRSLEVKQSCFCVMKWASPHSYLSAAHSSTHADIFR